MSTIELAVGHLRATPRQSAPARRNFAPTPAVVAIKTRVLCDHDSARDVPVAPRATTTPAAAAAHASAPRSSTTGVALAYAVLGAILMYAAPSLSGKPENVASATLALPVPGAPGGADTAEIASSSISQGAMVASQASQASEDAAVGAPPTRTVPTAEDLRAAQVLVAAWAQDWSDRDTAGYLGHYSAAFTPDKGLARSTWEAQRRNRLAAPRNISVAVHALAIEADGADRLIARFKQDFAADAYRETGTAKMLTLVREQGGWRIAAETEVVAAR